MPAAATRSDTLRLEYSGSEFTELHRVGTVPGVAVLAVAARCGTGTARLKTSADGQSLAFQAPDSSNWGTFVDVSAGGSFIVEDGDDSDKWIRVQVYPSYLPSAPAESKIYLADVYNDLGPDDVTAAEASAGDVATWQLALANDNVVDALEVKVWIDSAVSGLEISSDGVNYYAPTSENHADVIEFSRIAAGGSATLYLRRTIAAGASSDPEVLHHIHWTFTAI